MLTHPTAMRSPLFIFILSAKIPTPNLKKKSNAEPRERTKELSYELMPAAFDQNGRK